MIQIQETKYALESILAEFGETLPVNFINRMLHIGTPHIFGVSKNGIYYSGNSKVYSAIETITYGVKLFSVDDIKFEVEYLLRNLKWYCIYDEIKLEAMLHS